MTITRSVPCFYLDASRKSPIQPNTNQKTTPTKLLIEPRQANLCLRAFRRDRV